MGDIDSVTILAGGGGTRLWPASTEQYPKQFMKIASDKSLLLQALERSWALEPTLGVLIVCNQQYVDEIQKEVLQLSAEQVHRTYLLPEPYMRNTAAALFYANQWIEQLAGPHAVNLVQTSDHLIGSLDVFHRTISEAAILSRSQHIIVFGVEPSYPASGYGYIERGVALSQSPSIPSGFQVLRFTEKPDITTAKQFIASGRFYWNSGMFCYPVGLFRQELSVWAADVFAVLDTPSKACFTQWLSQKKNDEITAKKPIIVPLSPEVIAAYEFCPNVSVDYAVMEKTNKLALLPVSFKWSDIGSWDMLATLEENSMPLVEVGQSSGNFVRSNRPVALCNVRDLIVVEENGVLLICEKGASELVKEARSRLAQML